MSVEINLLNEEARLRNEIDNIQEEIKLLNVLLERRLSELKQIERNLHHIQSHQIAQEKVA